MTDLIAEEAEIQACLSRVVGDDVFARMILTGRLKQIHAAMEHTPPRATPPKENG